MIYVNVIAATTTTLIGANGVYGGALNKLTVCNNSLEEATINLFLEDLTPTQYSLVNNLVIPAGVTLVLEDNLQFNNEIYSLILTNSGTDPNLSIIIN